MADANPRELLAWAEANGIADWVLAQLRGGVGVPDWRAVAEQRAAMVYVQAEIVRRALQQMEAERWA